MTATEIVKELEGLGEPAYRKVLLNHRIPEPVFGVKIDVLKKYQKRIRKDYQLALDLYDTGVYDAMYLAGLIADPARMTKHDLRRWLAKTDCDALCGSTVPWVAAESEHGRALALEWIESAKEKTATAGWTTLASLVAITPDADLDLPALKRLLARVGKTIHAQPDRVRYAMNGFVIAAGTCVVPLTELALKTAETVGAVSVEMGNTACKVPFAPDYIRKAEQRGTIGKKRKTARC